MLIFHSFPSRKEADEFALFITAEFGRATSVHDTQDESDAVDPFPFELTPPIVLVERDYDDRSLEKKITPSVKQFGGEFAGT